MAQNASKSKLRRKKSSVEDTHQVTCARETPKKSRTTLFSSETSVETHRSVAPGAAAWWSNDHLSAAEALWALTLRSALPNLDNQSLDPVPDLPLPSAERPTAVKEEAEWMRSLTEEVAPLPEPSPPSPRTSPNPCPTSLSSSEQEFQLQTEPEPDPPRRPPSFHSRPSLESWEGVASSAGPSIVKRGSDNRVALQEEAENKREEVQGNVGGDGGLKSCPMCLMEFPAGFTQMDCDGHLAQCLSEVNVDMIW